MTTKNHLTISAVLALLMALGVQNSATATNATAPATTTTKPAPKPATTAKVSTPTAKAPTPTAKASTKPAPVDTTGPGAKAIGGLSFLTGKWAGELRSIPLMMDISIDGKVVSPGKTLAFNVKATPSLGMTLPIEGDYRSVVSWSETHRTLRAVMTDASGRGVEMTGGKVADVEAWLFSSTEEGAPFPFKVRITPVNKNQVIVAYSSGGRMPLKYDVTFNRVQG